MDDFASASELASAIRARELSAREALESHLERVRKLDEPLNAVVALDEERARVAAEDADAALDGGEETGPLHGVPMTIKDTWETEGLVTASGAPPLKDHVPDRDADAVSRLRDAGAVIFGKTNSPLMAGDIQTYNDVYGTTNNPWDTERTCGGSSGGAAAALATGMTPLELGSDIGGSIRTPASWCGVYGHKPTWGIIPIRGHIPGPPGSLTEADLGVGGPMARDPADLALALDALAGPGEWAATAWSLDLPSPRARELSEFRVAAWLDDEACRVAPEVRTALEGVTDALSDLGVLVDTDVRPAAGLADAMAVYLPLLGAVIGAGLPQDAYDRMRSLAQEDDGDGDDPTVRFARAMTISAREAASMNEWRNHQRAAWRALFEEVDVMLMPVVPVPAIPHDHAGRLSTRTVEVDGVERSYLDLFNWIAPASAARLPATTAPVGLTGAGLPVGVQIVGPHLEDATPIAFAQALADAGIAEFRPPPAVV